jgi:hypothetical protein
VRASHWADAHTQGHGATAKARAMQVGRVGKICWMYVQGNRGRDLKGKKKAEETMDLHLRLQALSKMNL